MSKQKFVSIIIIIFAALSVFAATMSAQIRNPTAQEITHAKTTGPCRDPWVSIALTYKRLGTYFTGTSTTYIAGIGDFGECNSQLYNGGSWSSFDELYRGVQEISNSGLRITASSLGNGQLKITTDGGGGFIHHDTVKVLSHDGGTLINMDGASIVINHGSNVVGPGGASYRVQSVTNEKRINLGKSVLVMRK
jgi:hypothetical protein